LPVAILLCREGMLPPTPRMPEVDSAECYNELLVPELCSASDLIAWKSDLATRGSKLAGIQQTDTRGGDSPHFAYDERLSPHLTLRLGLFSTPHA
jgi:hypothetical protein